jgi:hypothetical protein
MVICPQCGKENKYGGAWCEWHKRQECFSCYFKCQSDAIDKCIFTIVRETDGKYLTFKGDGTELTKGYKCVKSA